MPALMPMRVARPFCGTAHRNSGDEALPTLAVVVVEWLTFEIPTNERDEWMRIEESVWSRFLETCDGFLRKQMWVEEGDETHVHAVIWWESRAHWLAVSDEVVKQVDTEMGAQWKNCKLRVFDIVRDC